MDLTRCSAVTRSAIFPPTSAITGTTVATLAALTAALGPKADAEAVAARRRRIAEARDDIDGRLDSGDRGAARKHPLDPAWVSHCIDHAKDPNCIVVNEYTLFIEHCSFESPDLYFGSSSASGLGWGAGAALGAKLAQPDRPVMAVVGDGAYMFSNPAAVHHAAALHELPVLFVVMNNNMWGAVERSTLAMYPDGLAARSNETTFHSAWKAARIRRNLQSRGRSRRTRGRSGVTARALKRAMSIVKTEKRQALLNVICGAGGTA